MAWNEPGKDSKKPDPWGSGGQQKKDGPPDLDVLLKKFQQKIIAFLKKIGITFKSSTGPQAPGQHNVALYSILIVILLLIWVIPGFFIVQPAEKAIILSFGKYDKTLDSGVHWILPLVQSSYIVNVQEIATLPYQAQMLTKDENIVSVALTVQYRIDDPRAYLFNVQDPQTTLEGATGSALRQIIGNTPLDDILTSGQAVMIEHVKQQVINTMAKYQTGIEVMDVNLQSAKPPEEVTAAFDDAIQAKEDAQRYSNQAMAYSNEQIALAQGNAKQILAAANAYKQKVILAAQGATAQYLALLPQYQLAPQVTRDRLYLDTLQSVYANTTKILIEPSNNSVIYLPWDKLINQNQSQPSTTQIPLAATNTLPANPVSTSSDNSQDNTYLNDRLDRSTQPDRDGYPTQGDS